MKNSKLGAALCVVALVLSSGLGSLKAQSPQGEADGQRTYDHYYMNNNIETIGGKPTLVAETYLEGVLKQVETAPDPVDVIILMDCGTPVGAANSIQAGVQCYLPDNGFISTSSSDASYTYGHTKYGSVNYSYANITLNGVSGYKYMDIDGVLHDVVLYSYNSKYYLYYKDGNKYYFFKPGSRDTPSNSASCYLQGSVVEVAGFNGSGEPSGITGVDQKRIIWTQPLYRKFEPTETVQTRYQLLENAALQFIFNLRDNAKTWTVDHRVSVVKFGQVNYQPSDVNSLEEGNMFSNTSTSGQFSGNKCQLVTNFLSVKDNSEMEKLMYSIYRLRPGNATDGSRFANAFLKANPLYKNTNTSHVSSHKKVIVIFSTGEVKSSSGSDLSNEFNAAITNLKNYFKTDTEVYAVHIDPNDKNYVEHSKNVMKGLSSDYCYHIDDSHKNTPSASYSSKFSINLGTPNPNATHSYYMEYSDISNLSHIYAPKTTSTVAPSFEMNSSTIVKETLGEGCEVDGTSSDIKVYTALCTGESSGNYTFGTMSQVSSPDVTLSNSGNNQVVTYKGFDFSGNGNYVYVNGSDKRGKKVRIEIPVRAKADHFGMNLPANVPSNSTIVVNGSTGIGQNFSQQNIHSDASSDWLSYVLAKGDTESGISISGTTATISSNEGLAWFAAHANGYKGTSYANYNVELTADIDMAGKTWVPIGGSGGYSGTFNGNGHVISNLKNETSRSTYVGLFGKVAGGTVKNVAVKDCNFTSANAGYSGIIADEMTSGTVSGCVVRGSLTGSGYLGGVVGNVGGGTVHSCISMVAPANGGTLVHTGNVANSFTSLAGLLTTSGTATNCIYKDTDWKYVKSDGNEATITKEGFDYGKKGCVYSGSTERLVDVLNKYAKDNSYSLWAQPLTTGINEGVPVLKMEGNNTVVQDGGNLKYGDLANFVSGSNTMLFYGKKDNMATAYEGNNLYIDEDAALKVIGNVIVNAHTSRFIKNLPSREIEVWHHYSSPVAGQSLGIQYNDEEPVSWDGTPNTVLIDDGIGFFPTNTTNWDLYCFHEPAYHWINFKRNSSSHWYSENHTANIAYTNETEFTPGKGYLVALASSSYVQATGNLNHGTVEILVRVSNLSQTPGDKLEGFNLIGNPFQSYLKFSKFASANSGTDNNKIWTGSDKATYLIYSPKYDCYSQGSVATPSKDSQAASDYISMHQGFFIVSDKPCGSVENPTVVYTATFTDAMCSVEPSSSDAPFRGEDYAYPLINLIARDSEGVGDVAVVEFDRPEFTAAPKLFNYGGKGKVYFSYENEDDALLFLSEAIDQLPVHFDALEDAEYTLNWSTANADFSYLHLIDNITGADIDMLAHDSYSFSATTRDYKSRFKMKFAYTGIGENASTELVEVFAFLHDGNLIVNGQGTIDIIDMNGRTICNQKLTGEQNTVGLPNVAPGIYVVRLVNNSETKVQKIIVNK